MVAIRTQVYLTDRQRAALDELRRRERKTLAALIREAVDAYLAQTARDDPDAAPG
jgi:Spy/CpxP family protein refolding chaperone